MPRIVKAIRIGAAQLRFRQTVQENVQVLRAFVQEAANAKCDAVLFPECALTGYNRDFGSYSCAEIDSGLAAIADAARFYRCGVLLGSPTLERGKCYNSLLVFDRNGRETFRYHKNHLTARDARFFRAGNSVAFFRVGAVASTAIICHERRYPELVRLPVMLGAQIIFHPNAGLDALSISKSKRSGRDGIAVRAFENQVFYVFANSVGPQGDSLWSAGDSKIVAPDSRVLALANNKDEMLIHADLDLSLAGRKYAREALNSPAFLRPHWKTLLAACHRQIAGGSKALRQSGP